MTSAVLNDLIARVKAEAAAHAQRTEATGAAATGFAFASTPAAGAREREAAPVDFRAHRFMIGTDDEFIDNVYRQLLHREADDAGRATYRAVLAGGMSRLVVAGNVRLSPEGRRAGVPLSRLKRPVVAALAYKVLSRLGFGRKLPGIMKRLDVRAQHAEAARLGPDLIHHAEYVERRLQRHDDELAKQQQRVDQYLASMQVVPPEVIDAYYLAFEDANRGTREEIFTKLAIYTPWLAERVPAVDGLMHDVVDVGCGRGEWLSFVSGQGKSALGVDANQVMIDACREQGLDARHVDALTFLRSLPAGSVAAVTGFHVIEHLPFNYLFALVQESYRVLAQGGSVLFETPNPENVLVGSHTFYHDFTHRNPVTPTAISFLLKHHGFGAIDIIRSSPYPEEARLPGDDPLTARVNGHLCGPQDYAVTGTKGAHGAAA